MASSWTGSKWPLCKLYLCYFTPATLTVRGTRLFNHYTKYTLCRNIIYWTIALQRHTVSAHIKFLHHFPDKRGNAYETCFVQAKRNTVSITIYAHQQDIIFIILSDTINLMFIWIFAFKTLELWTRISPLSYTALLMKVYHSKEHGAFNVFCGFRFSSNNNNKDTFFHLTFQNTTTVSQAIRK